MSSGETKVLSSSSHLQFHSIHNSGDKQDGQQDDVRIDMGKEEKEKAKDCPKNEDDDNTSNESYATNVGSGVKNDVKVKKKNNYEALEQSVQEEPDHLPENFNINGLTDEEVEARREKYGWNEVKAKQKPEWMKILQRYFSVVTALMLIAALFAVCVDYDGERDWLSFGLLLFLMNLMVWCDYLGARSAQNAIAAVEKLSAPTCRAKRNGNYVQLEVRELVPGDIAALKQGVVIPADGFVCSEKIVNVDESALTGESLAINKKKGDDLLSGSTVVKGLGEMYVSKIGAESFYGKTITLLARAEHPGHLRQVLDKAAKIITGIACLFALFLFFWQSFFYDWKKILPHDRILLSLKQAFILIASVIPAAMPVVTTTVLAVGSYMMSKEKAVVSRLSAIEEAAGTEILCTDKTGTLTKNELTLFKEELICFPKCKDDDEKGEYTFHDVLLMASLASEVDDPEPIDFAINREVDMKEREKYEVLDYVPFNPVDKKTIAKVRFPDGSVKYVSKGAPNIIADLVADNDSAYRDDLEKIILTKAQRGLRTLGVCLRDILGTKEGDGTHDDTPLLDHNVGSNEICSCWTMVGYISLFDPPREDTAETIKQARELGIKIKMITGDQKAIAIETARQLDLGLNIAGPEIWKQEFSSSTDNKKKKLSSQMELQNYILQADGFAGVYPEQKFLVVDEILNMGKLCAMTGDGVNDAPALKRATVGIAVSGATDAAKASADIILFSSGLKTVITAFVLSRRIFRRIESYIIFRIYTSLIILIFFWATIVFLEYRFPSWTLVLISMINDFTLMSCSRDRVPASNRPLIWSMLKVSLVAIFMSIFGALSCVFYVYFSDPSHGVNWWTGWHLAKFVEDIDLYPDVPPSERVYQSSQTNSGVWLLLTILIQLSFHSARSKTFFCRYGKDNLFPSILILIPQSCSILITLFLSVYWRYDWKIGNGPHMSGLEWGHAGVTIFWGFCWFLVTDVFKVMAYKLADQSFMKMSLVHFFFGQNSYEKEQQKMKEVENLRKELDSIIEKRIKQRYHHLEEEAQHALQKRVRIMRKRKNSKEQHHKKAECKKDEEKNKDKKHN